MPPTPGCWRPSSTGTLRRAERSDGRVTIRPWRVSDADDLVRRINDPLVASFLDQLPYPYTHEDALAWVALADERLRAGTMAAFAVEAEEFDGPVGGVGVHFFDGLDAGGAEVGYWIAAEARGQGVATAATRLAAEWAFETHPELVRLQLRADLENEASNRVAEKAGFTREGVLRAQRLNARLGRRTDFVMWSLLRDEV
jgi:RimJ/RimL family protein N-acetyltransferase